MTIEPDDRFTTFRGGRALVTGGAGFIGSHLASALCELGATVRVLDDLSTGHESNLDGVDVELVRASILDASVLRDAMNGCRWVFHQAAVVSVPSSVQDPRRCADVNITGTVRVLETARDSNVERVMFASSAAVYGDEPNLPSRESDPIDCRSPYAASKAAGEAAMGAFAHCYDLDTVCLRYFNIFGPRQDPTSAYAAVIAAFAEALKHGQTPIIYGDGEQTRDFTFVQTVVNANLLAASRGQPFKGEIINIGTGVATSVNSLLSAMSSVLRLNGIAPQHRPARAGDVRHSVADIDRMRTLLSMTDPDRFEMGLESLLQAQP